MDKHSNKSAQIYGMQNIEEPEELNALRAMTQLRTPGDIKKNCGKYSSVLILRLIRLSSLTSSLVYFAILKEDSGSPSSNLSVVILLAAFALFCEWLIELILFMAYERGIKNIPLKTQYSRCLYLFGLISLISSLILSFVSFMISHRIISILIVNLLSIGSFLILLNYLFIGWLFSRRGERVFWGSFVFRTIALCGTGVCSIISIGFKIYELLPSLEPIDFWHPSWSIICIFLVIAHGIILMYEFFLKTDYSPQTFCTQFKKDYMSKHKKAPFVCINGFCFCLYLVLEVLMALKLDGHLPEDWDWRLILMLFYLIVSLDLFRMVYVGKIVISTLSDSKKNVSVENSS
jgi:hypothetical protein